MLIRDGDRGEGGEREKARPCAPTRKTEETAWNTSRTMDLYISLYILRQCPLAIAQQLVYCSIAISTSVLGRVTRTMSCLLYTSDAADER